MGDVERARVRDWRAKNPLSRMKLERMSDL